MKKLFVLVAVMVLVMAASCDTLNIGTEGPNRGPVIGDVTVTTTTSMNAGEPGTITVPWTSGTAPYTISITINGVEVVPAGTAAGTSPYTFDFTLEEGTIAWAVEVTDTNGQSGDLTGNYTAGEALNEDPTIENVAVAGGVVTVTVADTEGDDVDVTVTDIAGATVNANTVTVTGGNGDAVFTFTADVAADGVNGTTTITAADEGTREGEEATDTASVVIDAVTMEPTEGQVGAGFLATSAAVGDTVTVLVVAGDFPAGAAFNYMNGVGVTVNDGGDYVGGTFNVGSIGGEIKDVDGIWADMSPAPNTFFIPEDFMMEATDVTADGSLDFMGFNITPIGAGEVTGGGDLFNFGMEFDAAGTYTLGFLEFQDVKRTYYSDNAAVEYNWPDISNNVNGATTSITVN